MGKLILIRHGQSEWNLKGLWTGWTDVGLTDKGYDEAEKAGIQLKNTKIDQAYVSTLKRAQQTLDKIKQVLELEVPVKIVDALNERDYGIYTGKNKWEVKEQVGDAEFQKIRRSWDHPIPEGETMEDVYNRVVPFYQNKVLPLLKEDKNILLVAHGNSLRALTKYLENLSNEQLAELEIGICEVYVYEINFEGKILSKECFLENAQKGKI